MRLLVSLFLLFTLVPIVELMLLFKFADWTDNWTLTLAIVIFTGLLGAALAKQQGIAAWTRIRTALGRAELPGQAMVEGVLILVAGVVLVTPGFITDACGFLLLIPPTRRLIAARLLKRFSGRIHMHRGGGMGWPGSRPGNPRSRHPEVEDIDATRVDDESSER